MPDESHHHLLYRWAREKQFRLVVTQVGLMFRVLMTQVATLGNSRERAWSARFSRASRTRWALGIGGVFPLVRMDLCVI